MTISRNTFDPAKNYKRIAFHEDRQLLDSELNESQDIQDRRIRDIADQLLVEGAILEGLDVAIGGDNDHVLTIAAGKVYLDGHVEDVPEAVLIFDPEKATGTDTVYLELLKLAVNLAVDPTLVNPRTGEPTAERERWVTQLKDSDTSADPLPDGATVRRVIALFAFDRAAVQVSPVVAKNTTLRLEDLQGTKVSGPTAGQILRYDPASSAWKNEDVPAIPDTLNDLEDVAVDSPVQAQTLQFDGALGIWKNVDPPEIPAVVGDLSDVAIATPTEGQILRFAAGTGRWQNQSPPAIPSNIGDLSNVSATAPAKGQVLAFDGSIWIPSPPPRWIPLSGVTRVSGSQLGNIPSWVKKGWPLRIYGGSYMHYGIYSSCDPATPSTNWLGPSLPSTFQSVEVGTPDMVFEVPLTLDYETENLLLAGSGSGIVGPIVFAPRPILVPESYVCGVAYSMLMLFPGGESGDDPYMILIDLNLQAREWNNPSGTNSPFYYEILGYTFHPDNILMGVGEVCGVTPLRGLGVDSGVPYPLQVNFLLGSGIQDRANTVLTMGIEANLPMVIEAITKVTASLLAIRVGEHHPEWDQI